MTAQTERRTAIPLVLEAQGRKVRWFCDQVGISVSSYHMRERGERPVSGEYLRRAAKVLGVRVADLRPNGRKEGE